MRGLDDSSTRSQFTRKKEGSGESKIVKARFVDRKLIKTRSITADTHDHFVNDFSEALRIEKSFFAVKIMSFHI